MKKAISTCALVAAALAMTSGAAKAQATDPFIGQVMFTAASYCPKNWAPLDGTVIPIIQNTALFSLLGTNYGGNGSTTFQIPVVVPPRTSNGRMLLACIALVGLFPAMN